MLLTELFNVNKLPYINSSEFKEWFGNSKVVDEDGQPRVVYHGTMDDFKVFKLDKAKYADKLGYWFDVNKQTPNWFASSNNGGNVILAFLSIKNPLIYESNKDGDSFHHLISDVAFELEYEILEQFPRKKNSDKKKLSKEEYLNLIVRRHSQFVEEFRKSKIKEGYDGILLKDTKEDHFTRSGKITDWWIAFHPNQIKAALGNSGKFSKDSEDITESTTHDTNNYSIETMRDRYEYGRCMYLALAFNKLYGWSIYAEIAKDDGRIIHAWATNEKNQAVDINGVHSGNFCEVTNPRKGSSSTFVKKMNPGEMETKYGHIPQAEQIIKANLAHFGLDKKISESLTNSAGKFSKDSEDITESTARKVIFYHGSNSEISQFSLANLGTGLGNDEFGPGIYLTSLASDAARYGKIVHTVEVSIPAKRLLGKRRITREEIESLIKKSPDLEDKLTNWDENPRIALQNAVNSIYEKDKDYRKACEQVWFDFYHPHYTVDYINRMVELGYDGFKMPREPGTWYDEGTVHLVVFNPSCLHVVSKDSEDITESKQKNIDLYHVTPIDALDEIKTHGLKASNSKSSLKAVFLANFEPLNYTDGYKDGPWVVLKVSLLSLNQSLLGPDNYELRDYLEDKRSQRHWSDHTWKESLKKVGQVAYYGDIPSSALTVVAEVPGNRAVEGYIMSYETNIPLNAYNVSQRWSDSENIKNAVKESEIIDEISRVEDDDGWDIDK